MIHTEKSTCGQHSSCRRLRLLFTSPMAVRFFAAVALILLTGATPVFAELATEQEMVNVSQNFVAEIVHRTNQWAGVADPVMGDAHDLIYKGVLVARYYDVSPRGYVLVPVLKEMTPVKAYSDESNLGPGQEGGILQMIGEALYQRMQLFESLYGSLSAAQPSGGDKLFDPSQRTAWDRLAVAAKDFRVDAALGALSQAGPLLSSSWHQSAPFNNDCPMGDEGRCVVGCVATATAQILKFWEWPSAGVGYHVYTWNGDNSCGSSTPSQVLLGVFSDSYDWANIPDDCNSGCSPAQQAALAELNFEVGVAHEMDYGRCASGAYTARAAYVFPTFFKYKSTTFIRNRIEYTQQGWFDLIRQEIDAGRPMQYRINSHSIVCDGYRDDGGQLEFHMNYGWNEGHTTWYVLDNLYCYWITGSVCPYEEEFLIGGIEPQHDPVLALRGTSVADPQADGDGLAEPGETVRLSAVITNGGNDATSTTGALTTTDPYITVTTGSATFDPLIIWGSESTTQTPFEISIAPGCPDPHIAMFSLTATADGGYQSAETFQMIVGNTPGFADDVESGQGYWTSRAGSVGRVNEWHLETYRSHSGTTSWKMGGVGAAEHSNSSDAALVTPPLVLPPDAKLSFWHWIAAEDDANFTAWDVGVVMIRVNGGAWTQITPEGGYPYTVITGADSPFEAGTPGYSGNYDWSEALFDLSDYSGIVEIMLRFASDGAVTREGWYIDDVWVGNTLVGANVQLTPLAGTTVTFNAVQARGITTIAISGVGPQTPAGYAAVPASLPRYYSLTTSAAFSGSTQICLAYLDSEVAKDETTLKLMRYSGSDWQDVTASLNTLTNQICGTVTSFGPLLVVEKTSCCQVRVGDANGSGEDEPTIGDVSTMIDAKFLTGTCDGILLCLPEADVNQSGGVNPTCDDITVGDISTLIDYLFITGTELGLSDCL